MREGLPTTTNTAVRRLGFRLAGHIGLAVRSYEMTRRKRAARRLFARTCKKPSKNRCFWWKLAIPLVQQHHQKRKMWCAPGTVMLGISNMVGQARFKAGRNRYLGFIATLATAEKL